MPAGQHSLRDHLSRENEITITVTGRKSGRSISNPIWFISDEDKLYLLPVKGSGTQWYQNVLKNPKMTIRAGGAEAKLQAVAITDPQQVSVIVEKFRERYGAADVKKYYTKLDVAVVADIH
jgi:deazaflavin-dependent oxidoreductase (nitroreductase family)